MEKDDLPLGAVRAISIDDKLAGFFINLGAIKLQITFKVPIVVPDGFSYALHLEADSRFNILQN